MTGISTPRSTTADPIGRGETCGSNSLQTVIDALPALVWSATPDGAAVFFNLRWLDYTGLSADQARGNGWTSTIHPEDLPAAAEAWRRILESREFGEVEARFRRADGAYRWFLVQATPLCDGTGNPVQWYGTNTDIEDRKHAEESLRSDEQNLRLILDSISGMVATMDPGGGVLLLNRQVLDYFGKNTAELRNWGTSNVVHPDDLPGVLEQWKHCFQTGEPYEIEHRLRRFDGVYRWYQARGLPARNAEGRIIRWHLLLTDIDDRKRAEAELTAALEEIGRLKDRLHDENVVLREQIDQTSMFEEIIGSSPALRIVLSAVVQVSPTDATVLLTGETGTGKELIARAIHRSSPRSGHAFVAVNCASIPPSLIASELFGHEKGAFTGALQRRQGRFELAHSGTIFLDEIGELPAETQVALLRVLQERQFERVGGTRPIHTDVRIIAATNRDLRAEVSAGSFREDLFYRLNVFPIHAPPLRERQEDIAMLVEYFVKRYADKGGKRITKIEKNTLRICQSYSWPGNVRELQNIVERSVILCSGNTFRIDAAWLSTRAVSRPRHSHSLPESLRRYEKELIEAALAESNGKVAGSGGAAARLGIPRSTLDLKIKQLSIDRLAAGRRANSQDSGTS